MDEMEILDPVTGRSRFLVDAENQVHSTCKHEFLDDRDGVCVYCKKTKEEVKRDSKQ